MAIGSSLALLFKVGVDSKDAEKAFQQLMASNKEFAKGVEEGMKAEAQAFAGANTALKATNESAKQLGVTFNQVRVAIGQLIGGVTLVRAFREIAQAIGEIGTRSKEDFDTLQKQVESAGGHITELQRNIAQELLGAFDKVKGASIGFMAEVIETSGPAFINLLKDIAKWLTDLRPLAKAIGDDIADTLNRLNALGRTIEGLKPKQQGIGSSILEALFPPLAAKRALDDMGEFDAAYAKHLKNIQDENKKFVASPAGTDSDPAKIKKARQDLTDAALEQAKAEHSLSLIRQEAAVADREINQDQAKGLITQTEGAQRRLAVLAELQKAELALLDARQKAVQADPRLLPNQRASQLDDIDTQRAAIRLRAGDAEDQERRRTIDADQKLHDALTAHFVKLKQQWLDYAQLVHDQTDLIVQDLARQSQPIPGGDTGFLGLPNPDDVQEQLDAIDKHFNSFFGQLGDSILGATDIFTSFTDIAIQGLQGLTSALETTFQTFILTGQLGAQAFRTLTAALLANLAIEAIHQVFKMHAKGVEETAAAAASLAVGDYAGFLLHSLAAGHYHAAGIAWGLVGGGAAAAGIAIGATGGLGGGGAAGAAGGGFGGETKPGEIVINQGAGSSPLGIQVQQLHALNNISNKLDTASPGDVLTRGADQNPMVIGQANNEASRRDGSISREFLQISGLRTA